MHLSFHIMSYLDPLLSLTKRRPFAEFGNRVPGMRRPQSRDKALCHSAQNLGSRAFSGVKMV